MKQVKILNESDYSKFSTINGNRSVSEKKIQTIVNDIENGFNMLPYCPIIVDDKFNIIDGQHRFLVCQKINSPVYYVVCEDLTLLQIAQLNSRAQKWSINDFLNCYIKLGIEDYSTLNEVAKKHKISIATCGSLLMHFEVKSSIKEDFESGNFKVKHLAETEYVLQKTNYLFSDYVFSKDRYLIGAVKKLIEVNKCDFEKLKSKIAQAPMMMDRQSNVKSYIYNIERVYNFKNQNRETII
jgi:hypothetical protein